MLSSVSGVRARRLFTSSPAIGDCRGMCSMNEDGDAFGVSVAALPAVLLSAADAEPAPMAASAPAACSATAYGMNRPGHQCMGFVHVIRCSHNLYGLFAASLICLWAAHMGRRPVRWVWLQQSGNQLAKLEGDVQMGQGRLRRHRARQRLPTNALVQRGPCRSHAVITTQVQLLIGACAPSHSKGASVSTRSALLAPAHPGRTCQLQKMPLCWRPGARGPHSCRLPPPTPVGIV